jgi:hypothetical protein
MRQQHKDDADDAGAQRDGRIIRKDDREMVRMRR